MQRLMIWVDEGANPLLVQLTIPLGKVIHGLPGDEEQEEMPRCPPQWVLPVAGN